MLVTHFHIFSQSFWNYSIKRNWYSCSFSCKRFRFFIHNWIEECLFVIILEWKLSADHFVHYNSEWPDITSVINFFSACLFRWHISGSAHCCAQLSNFCCTGNLCESKVHYFYLISIINHNICSFNIPMNNSFFVSYLQTFGNLDRITNCSF